MVFEAAEYLADHDQVATEDLHAAAELLVALGRREAATEGVGGEQPALPGMGLP